MVRSWVMSKTWKDLGAVNLTLPPLYVPLDELFRKTGIEYIEVDLTKSPEAVLDKIKKEKGTPVEITQNDLYDTEFKDMTEEHKVDDKMLYVAINGSGYMDFRDKLDDWIRVEIVKGDLLVVPRNLYRRLIELDKTKFSYRMFGKKKSLKCVHRQHLTRDD